MTVGGAWPLRGKMKRPRRREGRLSLVLLVSVGGGGLIGCQGGKVNMSAPQCTLSQRELAQRRKAIAGWLRATVQEVEEKPDGFSLRFAGDGATAAELFRLVEAERRCCGFLTYELRFEPNQGPVWLRLRGDAQAKEWVRRNLPMVGSRHAE